MATFTDQQGNRWNIRITIGSIRKVLEDTASLSEPINMGLFLEDNCRLVNEVRADPLKLVAVLFSLCESQAKELGISEEEFGERLYGDSYGEARDALWEAYLDFCPSDQRNKVRELEAKMTTLIEKFQHQVMELDLDDSESLQQATRLLESLGLTQSPSHSASSTGCGEETSKLSGTSPSI